MLAFKCAQYEVCTCWSSIVQAQFGGEWKPSFEGEVWGDSEDEFALGEGGEATIDVGWQVSCSLLFFSFLDLCLCHTQDTPVIVCLDVGQGETSTSVGVDGWFT